MCGIFELYLYVIYIFYIQDVTVQFWRTRGWTRGHEPGLFSGLLTGLGFKTLLHIAQLYRIENGYPISSCPSWPWAFGPLSNSPTCCSWLPLISLRTLVPFWINIGSSIELVEHKHSCIRYIKYFVRFFEWAQLGVWNENEDICPCTWVQTMKNKKNYSKTKMWELWIEYILRTRCKFSACLHIVTEDLLVGGRSDRCTEAPLLNSRILFTLISVPHPNN